MTPNPKRLIEVAFPLKQVSLDAVHEKNVRHGHISTLHIWPARRPLAAARAALIATLLPDPGNAGERRKILERMAGRVVETVERKRVNGRVVEKTKEETAGGILHWGRENGPDLDWFRNEIRKAYGGRAPKVLDPFAGGGAIPLEAMRLGCEATAMDINPVAWFILKCTLEYPQKLAGQTRPLPEFALRDGDFMAAFLKAKGFKGVSLRTALQRFGHGDGGDVPLDLVRHDDPLLAADLAWHVRAWGRWVLGKARAELAAFYPTYAEWTALNHSPEAALYNTPERSFDENRPGSTPNSSFPRKRESTAPENPGSSPGQALDSRLRGSDGPSLVTAADRHSSSRFRGSDGPVFHVSYSRPRSKPAPDLIRGRGQALRGSDGPANGRGHDRHFRWGESTTNGEPSERLRLLQPDVAGRTDAGPLNAGFDAAYLDDPRKPRWVAKPTVAYLWARTVTCKQCRATLPLLKTRWLCKKDRKRVLLTLEPDAGGGVVFGVQNDPPPNGGNAAQRREHDRRLGAGTMSRTGATCPGCGAITTMADIRLEGRAGRLWWWTVRRARSTACRRTTSGRWRR